MKKILILLLVALLPMFVHSQKTFLVKGDGSVEDLVDFNKRNNVVDTLLVSKDVTEYQASFFMKMGEDTCFYENLEYKIVPTSWYISTKKIEDKVDVFLEGDVLNSKITKEGRVKFTMHRVFTIFFYLLLLFQIIFSIYPYVAKKASYYMKKLSAYSRYVLISSVVLLGSGILLWDFNVGMILFSITVMLSSMICLGFACNFEGGGFLVSFITGALIGILAASEACNEYPFIMLILPAVMMYIGLIIFSLRD